jgi:hypothetical protein
MITAEQWFSYVGPLTMVVLGLVAAAVASAYAARANRRIAAMEAEARDARAAK